MCEDGNACEDLNRIHRTIPVTEALFYTWFKIMWVVGGITIVGDFIIWSLWGDFELSSSIDIRMTIALVGCGWMAVCGVAAIIALMTNKVCIRKVEKQEIDDLPEKTEGEQVLSPVDGRIYWGIGIGVALLILIAGNILCWRAMPVSAEGREGIRSYVQGLMPQAEIEVEEQSGHNYSLEISGSTEHSYEAFSIDYMQNEDLLDQENFTLSLDFDCRHYSARQMMDAVEAYINAIDASVFADGDLTYVSSEFGKLEEQILARTASAEELEDYEEDVILARAAGDTTVYLSVEDSVINSYDGSSYKRINIRIHAVNLRWD